METTRISRLNRRLSSAEIETVANSYIKQWNQQIAQGHPLGPLVKPENIYNLLDTLNYQYHLTGWASEDTGEIVAVLGYSLQRVWWTDGHYALVEETMKVIDEELIGFGRVAEEYLEYLAKVYSCPLIMTGNVSSPQPKELENLYMKHGGFQFQYKQFIKVT